MVRDCFTFRFVSLAEGGQRDVCVSFGLPQKRMRKKGRKAEIDDDKNEEEKEKCVSDKTEASVLKPIKKTFLTDLYLNRLTRPALPSRCTPG